MPDRGLRQRALAPAWLGLALAASWLGLAARLARADVAPIPQIGENGYSLGPAGPTSVQMVSETVVLAVADTLAFTVAENQFEVDRPGALVTGDFLLRNPEAEAQHLAVGFPLLVPPAFDPNRFAETATFIIEDLRAWVNGVELPTRQAALAGGPWRVWDMDLPPGDSLVRVTYKLPVASPSSYAPDISLGYVLQTGAAWAGVIEHADLIVRFPYPAEAMFVEAGQTGFTVDGNDLRWTYTGLEPGPADDLLLTVVAPSYWRAVLDTRRAVTAEPSAANYGALAEAYSAIILPGRGPYNPDTGPSFTSPLIAQVAEAQLRKALELAPGAGNLHGQYGRFLASLAGSLVPEERNADAYSEYALAMALGADEGYRAEYEFILNYSGDRMPAGAVETATAIVPITAAPSATLAPAATAAPATPTAARVVTQAPTAVAALPSPTRAPATTTTTPAAPNVAPEPEPAPGLPWGLMLGFLFVFAIVVGGIVWLRRRPSP